MPKEAVFTVELEAQLQADFMEEAAGEDRTASQVMHELMRGYVAQRRQARAYGDYLQRKVDAGRASVRAGRALSNDEVEAAFADRRMQAAAGSA